MKVLVVLVAALACSQAAYNGPLASPVVSPNGFLVDTPEVAAAKAAHFSEFSKSASPGYSPGAYASAPSYTPTTNYAPSTNYAPAPAAGYYSPNSPSLTPQGFLADTPEIAAAKAAHFAEVAKTKSSSSYGPEAYDDGSYRPEYDNPSYNAPAAPAYNSYSAPAAPSYNSYSAPAAPSYNSYSAPAAPSYNSYSAPAAPSYPSSYSAPATHGSTYNGPLANPVVTREGFLAETPEVSAAKAAHFAEFNRAGAQSSSHGHRYRRSAVLVQTPASTAPLAVPHVARYAFAPVPAYAYAPYSNFGYSVTAW